MNVSGSPWLWMVGVFGAVTIIAFIVLQAAVLFWKGRVAKEQRTAQVSAVGGDSVSRWGIYAVIAVVGLSWMFILLKDTYWTPLTVLGVLAVVPYAYLQRKRAECRLWKTRSSVARALDEMQLLAESRPEQSILDAYPWLERGLKHNTFFQQFEARLASLIGNGLALRGNKADLERIAHEMQSEDLVQFIRRTWVQADARNQSETFPRAADDIAGRIHLDAEAMTARIMGQVVWLWLAVVAALVAAALLPLGGS